jgi:serine/threonine protein kinase
LDFLKNEKRDLQKQNFFPLFLKINSEIKFIEKKMLIETEISLDKQTPKTTIDEYTILKRLGKGGFCKVKLARDNQGNYFAIKMPIKSGKMQTQDIKGMIKEIDIMRGLDHPNILKTLAIRHNGLYTKKDGSQRTVFYSVLELARRGELYEYVASGGSFAENITRAYFKQLIYS